MNLEETIEICSYFSVYGKLLTNKQQQILNAYYFENLSLSEISENESITRQAVLDAVTKGTDSLKRYEETLKIVYNNKKIIELILKHKSELNKTIIKELEEIVEIK